MWDRLEWGAGVRWWEFGHSQWLDYIIGRIDRQEKRLPAFEAAKDPAFTTEAIPRKSKGHYSELP